MLRIIITLVSLVAFEMASAQSTDIQPVHNLTSGNYHETISSALGDADPGDHLELAAYQFTEHVDITIPITLSGAENGITVIDVSQEDGWGLTLSSDDITLSNLHITAGGVNTAYAVHSEPGITGITIEDVAVINSNRSCIDLNGLTGPQLNTVKNITVSGSAIGFGLALSSCSSILVENVTSTDNGFGDIAIMESNYFSEEIHDVTIMGALDLEGPQSLGGGGVIVQVSPSEVPVGSGSEFPINMVADGYDYVLEAPGDLTGCILVHNDNVKQIAATLGANVAPLVSYDLITQHMVVFPGMSVQSAVNAATEGTTIEVESGTFDQTPVQISTTVTLLGANAGTSGLSSANRASESIIQGLVITGGHPVIDGIKLTPTGQDGLELTETAAGLTLRNAVITGAGQSGVAGITARHDVTIEHTKVSGFETGISQVSGSLSMSSSLTQDNAVGLSILHDANSIGATLLQSCTFQNPGGIGIAVDSGDASDAFTMHDCALNLHGTALTRTAPMAMTLQGNTFSNSEEQVFGFDVDAKLDLCEVNTFQPALRIAGCTDVEANNFEPCANIDQGCLYLGCTAPKACNYDPTANTDDGSCDLVSCAGCPLGFACNYDPDADLYRVESCDFTDCEGQGMSTDGGGRSGMMVIEGCTISQACNYNPNADTYDGSCVFDCYGCLDNVACNYDAAFTMASNETCLFLHDLYASPHVDCDGVCLNDANGNGICDEEEVSGCTNISACNFLAAATLDDASCDFASCAGCTNPAACNHDADAWVSDGSCDYLSCGGCTEAAACNYDASAAIDDGSCTYPVDLYNKPFVNCDDICLNDADNDGICDEEETMGCTDGGACNYDEGATDDDNSCDYETCSGCTDTDYCNFNPGASIDDGSCATPEDLYPESVIDGVSTFDCLGRCLNDEDGDGICDEAEIACPGDLNGDGLRGASDILVMLSAFGCESGCGAPDLNGDGLVAASDVLMALATFGVACPE